MRPGHPPLPFGTISNQASSRLRDCVDLMINRSITCVFVDTMCVYVALEEGVDGCRVVLSTPVNRIRAAAADPGATGVIVTTTLTQHPQQIGKHILRP